MKSLRWGIIGPGKIATSFARALHHSKTGKLVAVAGRSQERTEAFAKAFSVPHVHTPPETILANPEVQAIYIATPHPQHAEWTIRCAEAGKHVLCEKPLAMNYGEAMEVIETARKHGIFLMEAFMYRCHPQTAKLLELVRQKVIGEVRLIRASFAFNANFNPKGRLFANELGGGGILDVGCYCTSMARLIAGTAIGKDFAEPIKVRGVGVLGETGVDEYTTAVAQFPRGIVAQLATGVSLQLENNLVIFGTEGKITVDSPWTPSREGGSSNIIITPTKGEPQTIAIETQDWLYAFEIDAVANNIEKKEAPPPCMTWQDSLGNMRMLDMWRFTIGQIYDAERPENLLLPVNGKPLTASPSTKMKYGNIPGLNKSVSVFIMGAADRNAPTDTFAIFDDYFRRGGNTFDTAFVYGEPRSVLLGHWIKNRNIREKTVIIAKGAHTPYCTPKDLSLHLDCQLEWLQTDYCDLYLMHRDNLDIPVGEFVDVLNRHVKQGRIKAFGGSNWTLSRIAEANEYARQNNLIGLSMLSNNFSLAKMIKEPWKGCLSVSDPVSVEWMTRHQFPNLSWSSQAQGFFTDRSGPGKTEERLMVQCWYSEDNFRRKQRAEELAAKKGVAPITIAAAYVISQPFPSFALIGPRAISETRSSLEALDIELTPKEIKWLNLED